MKFLIALCLTFAAISSSLAAEMSHEETIVRTAYAKLSYAANVNIAYKYASHPKPNSAELMALIDKRGLHFELSNFVVGNLSDIADKNFVDSFGGVMNGEDVIEAGVDTINHSDSTEGPTYSSDTTNAQWAKGQVAEPPHVPVAGMVPILEQESGISPLVRYCTYTVSVTLQQRVRTYKAYFIFGGHGEAAVGDTVIGINGGALQYFADHPAHPDILLYTRYRSIPAISDFLLASQKNSESCKSTTDVCCDPETLTCGVSSAELGRQP